MDRWIGKVALVTGASAGIGESIAASLVKNGMKVIGVARNLEKIQANTSKLSGESGKLYPMKCDVRNESEVKDIFEYAKRELGGVDVCINNAGLAHDAPLLSPDTSTDQWRDMLEINVLAVCVINREFMKQMKERGVDDGQIFFINSSSGSKIAKCDPTIHFYYATKFALTGLAEGVRLELRQMKSNIRVSTISPGPVRTEFRERVRQCKHHEAIKFYDNAFYTKDVIGADDISSAVVFMLSMPQRSEVNDIIIRPTGQML